MGQGIGAYAGAGGLSDSDGINAPARPPNHPPLSAFHAGTHTPTPHSTTTRRQPPSSHHHTHHTGSHPSAVRTAGRA
jgi:hypothetical protein